MPGEGCAGVGPVQAQPAAGGAAQPAGAAPGRVADPHSFHLDPDPAFMLNTYPDPGLQ